MLQEFFDIIMSFLEWFFETGLPKETVQTFYDFGIGELAELAQKYINVFFA